MSFLPSFTTAAFAIAGLCCALGPVIIHLLNRRRFRVVQWAAMDFLREAIKRNRRIMQFRDLLLLLLRVAAVIFFGLALARPYYSASEEEYDASAPLHAVLIVDNSLSMGYQYEEFGETLLDRAKQVGKQFVDELPKGSRVSVVPLCGSGEAISPDPYRRKEDAVDALDKIEVVDRAGSIHLAASRASTACESAPRLAKRVVLLSDQQSENWRGAGSAKQFEAIPSMQIVDVSPETEVENTWVSGLAIQDGVADVETPTTFVVELRHRGPSERKDVQVTLWVDGAHSETKTVSLQPGEGTREITFEHTFSRDDVYRHRFDSNGESAADETGQGYVRPVFVPVKVSLPTDRLPEDDDRHLIVPVVASLPVVFLDQVSAANENPQKGIYGETFHLRKLLAPRTRRVTATSSRSTDELIRIDHISSNELSAEDLRERIRRARLVVIGGVAAPSDEVVDVLREYVLQGGQVVLAGGGRFDPARWSELAWRDGAGILPAPLSPEPVGASLQEDPANAKWFYLDFNSLKHHDYFVLAGNSEEQLTDLYSKPLFFKAVSADVSDATKSALIDEEKKRLAEVFVFLEESESRAEDRADKSTLSKDDESTQAEDEQRLSRVAPNWLQFGGSLLAHYEQARRLPDEDRQAWIEREAQRSTPSVLARFDNGIPFMVERNIGQGRVLFVSTGVFTGSGATLSGWNTLSQTHAVALFDRVLRAMMESTLPQRNFEAIEEIVFNVPKDGDTRYQLTRPGAEEVREDLFAEGAEIRSVTIQNALTRGTYEVTAYEAGGEQESDQEDVKRWVTPLGINGPAEESDLIYLTRDQFDERNSEQRLRWVGRDESISLAGSQVRGQNWWKYLALAVLLLLLIEMGMLAWFSAARQTTNTNGNS